MRIMFNLAKEPEDLELVPAVVDVCFFEYDLDEKFIVIFDSTDSDNYWYSIDDVEYSDYVEYARELFETGKLDLSRTGLQFEYTAGDFDDDFDDEEDDDV